MSSSVRRAVIGFLASQPIIVGVAAKYYRETHRPKLPKTPLAPLVGKVVLVTGGTSGIGEAAVASLGKLGADLICVGRSEEQEYRVDLSDMKSVERLKSKLIEEDKRPDIILSCAAEIFTDPSTVSVDGYDATFATNALGLQSLLSGFEDRRPEKVVIVASKLERSGEVEPSILKESRGRKLNRREGDFNAVKNYGDTKLCNQLLATTLADRWHETKVLTVSPGMVDTGLWRNFPTWFQTLTYPVRAIALRSPEDAALGIVYAIAAEEMKNIQSGSFLVDGKV
eukprot:CAMPEP_0118641454 /NCGR_PEP_ID=MMETSP0785-20121206/5292_1 /TAXON_ID=91992 /ORGANISM="Bolidomonas pacifica, Strain CCMP 1866" /LENGTH=282 /DNA_ID=CAMNT_0006532903 /DNA_START=188 /DNA_END=1033 /DNA_ORIENTATION=-